MTSIWELIYHSILKCLFMYMRLLGRNKISYPATADKELSKWIAAWTHEVQKAYWKTPADILKQYPNALHKEPNSFIFKINSAELFLEISVCFLHQIALIVDCRGNTNISYGGNKSVI